MMEVRTAGPVDEVAVGWRLGRDETGHDNPAGPLYLGGSYAAGEITATDPFLNTQSQCPTWLTNCPLQCPIFDGTTMVDSAW
jgi:hypothetical protein